MEKIKKLTKNQLLGLRNYRRLIIKVLSIVVLIALWFKIGFNGDWHLNDVIVEVITLFILILMGIVANTSNGFPIFQARKFKFTKEFIYSIVASFSLLFIFMIYKNIVDPDFISYIAELSFHDLCTILVFIFPIFLFVIYLIYLSFKLFDGKKIKNKSKLQMYSEVIEDSLNHYKSLTIKVIFILMIVSLWVKVGLNPGFSFYDISTECFAILTIVLIWILGNLDNRLSPLYNCHIKLDRYFFYSILLPYLLVLIYAAVSNDFRFLLSSLGFKGIVSLIIYMFPLFFAASMIFFMGCRYPNLMKQNKKKFNLKKDKVKLNAIISLLVTLFFAIGLFYYSFTVIVTNYTLENILQATIVFIPLFVIIYLIIYSGIKEINK